jgi:ATP-dependent Clp protease protease subunit
MKIKLLVGLIVLGIAATVSLNSLTVSEAASKNETIVLSKDNLIVLNGEVNGENSGAVIAKAKELDAKLSGVLSKGNKPIYLFLYTPGGSVQYGLEMIEALKGLGRPVNTITLFAASMGFQLAQSLDERLILHSGVLMSHHARGESEGEFGGLAPTQMDNRMQIWIDRIRELDEQTVKRTNGKQTYESYTKQYDHEMWLTGTKSVAQGYADKIVTIKCDKSLSGVTTHSLQIFGMTISYDLDNCPINTSPSNVHVGAPDGLVLNQDKINEIRKNFLEKYENSHKQAMPLRW